VLFTPQPPAANVLPPAERRLRSSRKIAPLAPRTARSSTSLSRQVTDSDVSSLHLPTEETVSGSSREYTLPSLPFSDSHPDVGITRTASLPDPLASTAGVPIYFSVQPSNADGADREDHVDQLAWEQDRRIRQEIWNGLDFLERRNQVLRSSNARLIGEVEMLNRENARIRQAIEETERRLISAESLNEELKTQLDQLGKENSVLNEKALGEWKLRVGAEEKYVEEKRRSDEEVKSLKDEVERKNAEIKLMEIIIQNNNTSDDIAIDSEDLKRRKEDVRTEEDIRDLVNRFTMLQTTVDAVRNERNRLAGEVSHLSTEATMWRERFEAKCSEFDVLAAQFESLRLTMSHLQAENRNLRGQYVQIQSVPLSSKLNLDNGNGSSNAAATGPLLNPTWPKTETKTAPSTGANGAQLHHVQLPVAAPIGTPSSTLKGRPGSKESTVMSTMTPVVLNPRVNTMQNQHQQQQRRRRSDESSSGLSSSSVDSLPPVLPSHNHSTATKFSK